MSTLKQIDVNRLNSQKISAPRSDTVGRILHERTQNRHQCATAPATGRRSRHAPDLTDEHHAFWNPAASVECDLVGILVRTTWLLRRPDRVEDESGPVAPGTQEHPPEQTPGGRVRPNCP
jgi:hypothetical protein